MKKNKGYVLYELLICMLILSVLLSMTINFSKDINFIGHEFSSEYSLIQSKALLNNRKYEVINKGISNKFPIYFNKRGNINMAQTINYKGKSYIIRLGYGNLIYE